MPYTLHSQWKFTWEWQEVGLSAVCMAVTRDHNRRKAIIRIGPAIGIPRLVDNNGVAAHVVGGIGSHPVAALQACAVSVVSRFEVVVVHHTKVIAQVMANVQPGGVAGLVSGFVLVQQPLRICLAKDGDVIEGIRDRPGFCVNLQTEIG